MARTSAKASSGNRSAEFAALVKSGLIRNELSCGASPRAAGTEITSLIEAEVIPRLLLLHSKEAPGRPIQLPDQVRRCGQADVAMLTTLVLSTNGMSASLDAAGSFVDGLLHEGAQVEDILLNLLAPVARKLGEMWTQDQADFFQVTSGVCELQRLVHKLSPADRLQTNPEAPQVLLLPAPQEQHTFGLLLVSEMFRADGWNVTANVKSLLPEIERAVRLNPFEVVGFSLSCEILIEPLVSAIDVARTKSCLASTKVMVGGHAFDADPDLHLKVGADMVAKDANHALALAKAAVAERR